MSNSKVKEKVSCSKCSNKVPINAKFCSGCGKEMTEATYCSYRFVVMGVGGVGKSSIVLRFISSTFVSRYDPTIEDRYTKQIDHHGVPVRLEILDTAGQDTFCAMRELYYQNGDGFILVYSIKHAASYTALENFHQDITRFKGGKKVPIVLVGNKTDLESQREVAPEKGKNLANQWGVDFIETSAKRGENIDTVFHLLIDQIWEITGATPDTKDKKDKKPTCILL